MKNTKFHNEEIVNKFGKLEDKKYLAVMDLELTCWDGKSWDSQPRDKMEITEIGVEILDLEYNSISKHTKTVKPIFYPILSDYCKNLTHISQEEIHLSKNLNVTAAILKEELPDPREFVWTCWGRDATWLQDEIVAKSYKGYISKRFPPIEFDPRFVNVKLCYGGRGGLKKALSKLNLQQVLPAHRALADAESTSKVVKALKLGPLDAQISNDRTYREALNRERKDMVDKLAKRLNLQDKDKIYNVLKLAKWDFMTALNIFKNFSD